MPLGVNKNLAAFGILNGLTRSQRQLETNIQRLATGLRINSAADDPAGLVVSEAYRRQVDALGQGMRDATDGANLVQTADGALGQISVILRSMRSLALHAANTGASDAASVQADQEQIESALATIGRITSSTQFGSRRLLDGSSGVMGMVSDSARVTYVDGTTRTASGRYAVDVTTAATKGALQSSQALTVATMTLGTADQVTLSGAATLTLKGDLLGDQAAGLDITFGDTDLVLTASQFRATLEAALASHGITGLSLAAQGTTGTVITSRALSGGGASELWVQATAGAGAADLNAFLGTTTAKTADTATASADTATLRNAETLTFTNGGSTAASVSLAQGRTLASAVHDLNSALSDAGIQVTAAFDNATHRLTFTDDEFGSRTTVLNTLASSLAGSTSGATINTAIVRLANQAVNIAGATSNNGGGAVPAAPGAIVGSVADVKTQTWTLGMTGDDSTIIAYKGTGNPTHHVQVDLGGTLIGTPATFNISTTAANLTQGALKTAIKNYLTANYANKFQIDTNTPAFMTIKALGGVDGNLTMSVTAKTSTNTDVVGTSQTRCKSFVSNNGVVNSLKAPVYSGAVGTDTITTAETLTFADDRAHGATFTFTAGQSIATSVTALQAALDGSSINAHVTFSDTDHRYHFQTQDNSSVTVSSNITSGDATNALGTVDLASSPLPLPAGTAARAGGETGEVLTGAVLSTGSDVAGSIGGEAASSSGQYLHGTGAILGLTLRIAGGAQGSLGNVTVSNRSLAFQVGAFGAEAVQLAISDMRTSALGTTATGLSSGTTTGSLAEIDITRDHGTGAEDAVRVLDAASGQVNHMRASLGAFLNGVLRSTLSSLSVAQQNLRVSDAQIRDANVAEETLKFTRGRILQQTSLAMLTQANQAPRQLMGLFGLKVR